MTAHAGDLTPAMTSDQLTARLEALHREPWKVHPATWIFQGTLLSGLIAPFALWIFSMVFVVFFLANYWNS